MFLPSAQMVEDMRRWEGSSLKVYADSKGLPTQGVGRHHGVKFGDPDIDMDTEARWLAEDVQQAYFDALDLFPNLNELDVVRREAIIALAFNMGRATLSEFVPFIHYVTKGSWASAALHLMTNMAHHLTPYLTDVGERGVDEGIRIASGEIPDEFLVL
jgi:GH24 family phage-related lysozyme (muramidase)